MTLGILFIAVSIILVTTLLFTVFVENIVLATCLAVIIVAFVRWLWYDGFDLMAGDEPGRHRE